MPSSHRDTSFSSGVDSTPLPSLNRDPSTEEEEVPTAKPVSFSEVIDAAVTMAIQNPTTLLSNNWGLIAIVVAITLARAWFVRRNNAPLP